MLAATGRAGWSTRFISAGVASLELRVRSESWPIAGSFAISRGAKTSADVVVVELSDGRGASGRGECVPYARYGESLEGVVAKVEGLRGDLASGRMGRSDLQGALAPGAARNALDCAFWDLEGRRQGRPVYELAGLPSPAPVHTAYTLSLDTPEAMGQAAAAQRKRPLLKIKLGGEGDIERVAAIRENAPRSRLIVDANEGWSVAGLEECSSRLAELDIALIEQPLPAAADAVLEELEHPVPLCADESCHTSAGVERLAGRYEFVNVKLDKTGGLTEALAVVEAARNAALGVLVGCMVGTSLAMAPAALLARDADFVDLDGPLLLQRDRTPGLRYEGSLLHPPARELWG